MTRKYNSGKTLKPWFICRINSIQNSFFILVLFILALGFNLEIQGQYTADFTVDVSSGCSPLTVTFTNTSDSGGFSNVLYGWEFGDGSVSSSPNPPPHIYTKTGKLRATLHMFNKSTGKDTSSFTREIDVIKIVSANFTQPIPPTVCRNENVEFKYDQSSKDSVLWNFGDGRLSRDKTTFPIIHRYSANGNYTITYITYNQGCNDTSITPITVSGPSADYTITPDSACKGETITFTATNLSAGVDSLRWFTDEGATSSSDNPFIYTYSSTGSKYIKLDLKGATTCRLRDTVYIYPLKAGIAYGTAVCANSPALIKDNSTGSNLIHTWDLGDDSTSTDISFIHTYQDTGLYVIKHRIENPNGCSDETTDTIFVPNPPALIIDTNSLYVCFGDSSKLEAAGGDVISWSPSTGLDDPGSYTPIASPEFTTPYLVEVTDTTSGCKSSSQLRIDVQREPDWAINLTPFPETTVIIGDTAVIQADSTGDYLFTWSPDYRLISCLECARFVTMPLETTAYSLEVTDDRKCYKNNFEVTVNVREEYRVGVADAFTPNNDGINDILKVNGWGIKDLIEFRVYNRWGKQVFLSDDIRTGWDGTINGKPAAIDSYAYYVKVEMWDDQIVEKNGMFSLVK